MFTHMRAVDPGVVGAGESVGEGFFEAGLLFAGGFFEEFAVGRFKRGEAVVGGREFADAHPAVRTGFGVQRHSGDAACRAHPERELGGVNLEGEVRSRELCLDAVRRRTLGRMSTASRCSSGRRMTGVAPGVVGDGWEERRHGGGPAKTGVGGRVRPGLGRRGLYRAK